MTTRSTMPTTLGIYKRFPSIKSYLKSYAPMGTPIGEKITQMAAYGAGDIVSLKSTYPGKREMYGVTDADQGMMLVSLSNFWSAIQNALKGVVGWEEDWRAANAYSYWHNVEDHAWHLHALDEFENKAPNRPQKLTMMSFPETGFCLGNCVSLGWLDYAERLARITIDSLQRNFFFNGKPSFLASRIQYFVLRLVFDWRGETPKALPSCAYDEPLYESLLRVWRMPDSTELEPLLIAALDRHTHQARYYNARETFDLPGKEMFYVPFEVLSVLRLRESLGLSVPIVAHPLMNTALGKLPPVTPPYTDDLLASVLARIEQQLPQFKIRPN